MFPADTFAEITANLAALQLSPNTAAQILAAVFAPLLRSSDPPAPPELAQARRRAGQPRRRPRRAARSKPRAPRASANTSVTPPAKRASGRSPRSEPTRTPPRPNLPSSRNAAAAPSPTRSANLQRKNASKRARQRVKHQRQQSPSAANVRLASSRTRSHVVRSRSQMSRRRPSARTLTPHRLNKLAPISASSPPRQRWRRNGGAVELAGVRARDRRAASSSGVYS